MKNLLIAFLITVIILSLGTIGYTAYDISRQTYHLSAENDHLTEFEIPAEGDGPVINRYTAHAGEPMEINVLVTLTVDENGNIAG